MIKPPDVGLGGACRTLTVLVALTTWSPAPAQDVPPPVPKPDFARASSSPVVSVVDERCVRVLIGGVEREVELCGVRVSRNETARDQLRLFLENLLTGEAVLVEFGPTSRSEPDKPRPACLFRAPDGLFINLEVIRQGYARTQGAPDCEHLEVLCYYERLAKRARKGVWAPALKTDRPGTAVGSDRPSANVNPKIGKITVYVTKSGKKYHKKGCQHLRKSSRPISLEEAVAKGYEPCSRCKPPTLDNP